MRRNLCLKGLFLICFVLFSVSLYAQDLDTSSSIDQALIELNNLEQNQIALKNLIIERENTIIEKDKLLNQMTLQYQSLDNSFLLLRNENKFARAILVIISAIVVGETTYLILHK
jgi:hypothetical protein